jgi:hypothetical protein
MSPERARAINAALGELPLDDRVTALICSVIERRPQMMPALLSMLATLRVMARYSSIENKIAFAEFMRDAADEIEHAHEVERV